MGGCAQEEDRSFDESQALAEARVAAVSPEVEIIEPNMEHCFDPIELADLLLERINEIRTSGQTCKGVELPPVHQLIWDGRLENAAILQADDMATHNFLSHTGSDGSSSEDRKERQDYIWSTSADNIAATQTSVDAVLEAWTRSTNGHCENLLNEQVVHVGAACIYNPQADYEYYWTLELGSDF